MSEISLKPRIRVRLDKGRYVPTVATGVEKLNYTQRAQALYQGQGTEDGPIQPPFVGLAPASDSPTTTGVMGVAGLKTSGGRVVEEYLPQLRGQQGVKLYKEMSDNDATIGAVMFAIEQLLRGVKWRVMASSDKLRSKKAAKWVQSLMVDMSHTWEDFISEALSNLIYGFSVFEICYKYRNGPTEVGATSSKFSDGLVGWRKFAPRGQDTIYNWLWTEQGSLQGYVQMPWSGGGPYAVPMQKSLLFRTTSRKNNPEGRSILRNAYRSWYFLKAIQEIEAIAIERELAGLPVIHIPNSVLTGTDPKSVQTLQSYIKMARDVKLNEQGGIVVPSDHFLNADGNPSQVPMVRVELLSTNGRRQINTTEVKSNYSVEIARTVLADFITLGGQKGSYALSVNKTDMFTASMRAWLDGIAAVINTYGLQRLWKLNNLNPDDMPAFVAGSVDDVNLGELGTFIQAMASAGFTINDSGGVTEGYLRDVAHLPSLTGNTTTVPQANLNSATGGSE